MNEANEQLVQAAIAAAHNAYAPYSNFHVGAALLLDNGEVVTGANFENASYGMTLCAETVAIAKANSDGQMRRIVAIAVAGGPRSAEGVPSSVPIRSALWPLPSGDQGSGGRGGDRPAGALRARQRL